MRAQAGSRPLRHMTRHRRRWLPRQYLATKKGGIALLRSTLKYFTIRKAIREKLATKYQVAAVCRRYVAT